MVDPKVIVSLPVWSLFLSSGVRKQYFEVINQALLNNNILQGRSSEVTDSSIPWCLLLRMRR